MNSMTSLYRQNLSLLTDFYQLTMVYAAWKNGQTAKKTGVFDLYFRNNPFKSGFAVGCGLSSVIDFVENFKITGDDCKYLATLSSSDGKPMFEADFLKFLESVRLEIDIDAIEEGRIVFANEPMLRVTGPIWQCQLLETPFLNMMNYETLIATKAARVKEAAGSAQVLEFGLRRAQGIDGGLAAARAAYIGGVDATSNILAGKIYGIPLRGTHAHSWVMSFDTEMEAFEKFAEAMPGNCIFLVDTYNTLDGVRNAIEVGKKMKAKGQKMLGIRLDSGDLAYLSAEARKMLDAAGLTDAKIVASNDLDENLIQDLNYQGAKIDIWGIGTKLVTGYDQPSLGGVFKLVAMKDSESNKEWKYRIKLSEQIAKVTTPGVHQVRRYIGTDGLLGDMIFDERYPPAKTSQIIVDPLDPTRRKDFSDFTNYEDLLKPVVRKGKVVIAADEFNLEKIRKRRADDIGRIHPTIKRFLNPHAYPVGLELGLHNLKSEMVLQRRGFKA